jgi:ribonucleoside-diphosphate reductase alpha chain
MKPTGSKAIASDERFADQPALSENARKVLEARYLKKNEAGVCVETPAQLFRRVAATIADVEYGFGATTAQRQAWEERFYALMTSGAFMPNSPTLMNAGREMGMLSACFVLPVRDSIVDIFDSIKHTALIQKAGGGTGFAFDELRPTGDFIQSSGGTTSGPISFWRAFSEATNAIQQGAFRRGANMGMMYIHHPDILKFLHAKQDLSQFTNYNISVKITDTWMEEFRAAPDAPHVVRNPRDGKAFVIPRALDIWKYNIRDLIAVGRVEPISPTGNEKYYASPRLVGPLPVELQGKVYSKRDLWDIIVNNAWQTGEPGIVFIDRINEHNPTPQVGRIEATNPCGEQPLLPYEACNLGSVNLGLFVRKRPGPAAQVDWDGLREAVQIATRFLDNVIDANSYPLPEIDAICKANRKIGLGVMGFADALFKLGAAYNSEEGVTWGERFMEFVNDEAHRSSEELARARGCFPNWKGSVWHTEHQRPMRNAAVTTVAPTGTISIIASCSSGIEPLFSLAFLRNVLRGQQPGQKPLIEVNEPFRQVAEQRGFFSPQLLDRLATEGSLAQIEGAPPDIKRVFVCAHDVTPEWHMRMQAAFQRHCDSSISKTINFPHDATRADVAQIYHMAYELGCKGVTVYRDRCREMQPMALKNDGQSVEQRGDAVHESDELGAGVQRGGAGHGTPVVAPLDEGATTASALTTAVPPAPFRRFIEPQDLPEIVSGLRIRQMTPFGNMHVKITVDPRADRELEVFAQLGKGGDVATSDLEAICRMVSLWLRAGGSLRHVIKQLEGIGSSLQIPTRAGRIMSLGDGLACALKKYTRAKERFGLRALLLGEIDLGELDKPVPAPHDRLSAAPDRALGAVAPPVVSPTSPPGSSGHGGNGGSGAGKTRSADAPGRPAGVERRGPECMTRFDAATEGEGTSRPVARHGGNGHGRGDGQLVAAVPARGEVLTTVVELEDPESALQAVACAVEAAVSEPVTGVAVMEEPQHASDGYGTLVAFSHYHDAASGYILRCPQCGGVVVRQEGCLACANHCGWAAC